MKRIAVWSLFVWGIASSITVGRYSNSGAPLTVAIGNGIVIGAIVTAIAMLLLCAHHKRKHGVFGIPDAHQSRRVELDVTHERAFALCLEALAELGRKWKLEMIVEDEAQGIISARVGEGWRRMEGDVITFELARKEGGSIDIAVNSRPFKPKSSVDWGHNHENVEAITGFLTQAARPD